MHARDWSEVVCDGMFVGMERILLLLFEAI